MAQRSPRSPEPRGIHAFAGALGTDRLNPGGVPDPLDIGTINADNINVDNLDHNGSGAITVKSTINFDSSGYFIGSAGTPLGTLYVTTIVSTTVGATTGNITTVNATTLTTTADANIGSFLKTDKIDDNGAGTISMYADTIPNTGLLSLGNSSNEWLKIYVKEITAEAATPYILVDEDLVAASAGSYDLGESTTSRYWRNGYIDSVYADDLHARVNSSISVNDDLKPSSGTKTLGTSATAWGKIYVDEILTAGVGSVDLTSDLNLNGAHIDFDTDSSSANAGLNTLPSNPRGFVEIKVNGVTRKVPYYDT